MICPKCGENAESKQKFCGKCGYDFSEAENEGFIADEEPQNEFINAEEESSEGTDESWNSKKRKIKKVLLITTPIVAAVAIIITAIVLYLNSYTYIYNKGLKEYENGQYFKAYHTLLELTNPLWEYEKSGEQEDLFKVTALMKQCYYASEEEFLRYEDFSDDDVDVFKIETRYLSWLKEYGIEENPGRFDGMETDVIDGKLIFHQDDYSQWGDFVYDNEITAAEDISSCLEYSLFSDTSEEGIIFIESETPYSINKLVTYSSSDRFAYSEITSIYSSDSIIDELLYCDEKYIYFSEKETDAEWDDPIKCVSRIPISGSESAEVLTVAEPFQIKFSENIMYYRADSQLYAVFLDSNETKKISSSVSDYEITNSRLYYVSGDEIYSAYIGETEVEKMENTIEGTTLSLDELETKSIKTIDNNKILILYHEYTLENYDADVLLLYSEGNEEVEVLCTDRYHLGADFYFDGYYYHYHSDNREFYRYDILNSKCELSPIENLESEDCVTYTEINDTLYYITEENQICIYNGKDNSLKTVDLPHNAQDFCWELKKTETDIIICCSQNDAEYGEYGLEFYTIDSENRIKRLS